MRRSACKKSECRAAQAFDVAGITNTVIAPSPLTCSGQALANDRMGTLSGNGARNSR